MLLKETLLDPERNPYRSRNRNPYGFLKRALIDPLGVHPPKWQKLCPKVRIGTALREAYIIYLSTWTLRVLLFEYIGDSGDRASRWKLCR